MSCKIKLESLDTSNKRFIEKNLTIDDDQIFDVDKEFVYVPFYFGHSNFELDRPKQNIKISTDTVSDTFIGTLRPNQMTVRNCCIRHLNKKGCIILAAEPGFGKTITAIEMICSLNMPTMIIVKQTMIANQWISAIKNYAPSKTIQQITSSKPVEKGRNVYVVNPIILKPQVELEKILKEKKRKDFSHIKFVIVDEMHQIVSKVLLRSFFKIQPDYIIGLSATPRRPKNDPYQKAISWFFGNVVVGKELFKKHTVYSVETNFTPNEIKYTPKGVDWIHILRSQAQDNNRNNLIADIVMRFPNRIWLILVKLVEHATRLKAIFNSRKISCETLTGSKTEFDRDCKILIGTTSKIGVGFDHAPIDALFVAADVVEYFEQFLGRCMRKVDNNPIVFDLDDTYSILHRHFEDRLKKYKKHGGKIFENIDLNEITNENQASRNKK